MAPKTIRGRVEDRRLLTGAGCFIDDVRPDGVAHAVVLRSPHAHARIVGLDVEAARTAEGVQCVLTAAELTGLGPLKSLSRVIGRDGRPNAEPRRPILAEERVHHVGEAVAFVVAEHFAQALDASELIEATYQELPAVTDPLHALAQEAPQIWPEAPANLSFDWQAGDAAAVEAACATAAHLIELTVHHPRIVVAPIETRGALGTYDTEKGRYLLQAPSQGVHRMRSCIAEVLGIGEELLQVVTPEVGGSFGTKIFPYPEYALVLHAARLLGRPVHWMASRSEAFLADAQGRARVDRARLALDRDGTMLALEVDAVGDLGAYLSTVGAFCPTEGASKALGQLYRIPAVCYRAQGVFTNTAPTDAYRGAGKPESATTLECLIDQAARQTGLNRVELRRRNLVRPGELPFTTAMGQVIDSGDFPALLDRALALADWDSFADRAEEARRAGRCRGIGLGLYLHTTGGNSAELSRLTIRADGSLQLLTGTQASGQGHETVLAEIAARELGIEASRIVVVQGDSDLRPTGGGTGGSSLLVIAGTTVVRAAGALIARGRELAAERLEAAAADIVYEAGRFAIVGTDRGVTLAKLARDAPGACFGEAGFAGTQESYPNGAYVAEVELDPETGIVALRRLTGLDDLGRVINPALAEGQLHGGWAQGIGAALMERTHYDPKSGQLLSGSFMDYQLPRAEDLPLFRLEQRPEPCRTNALGVKGAGEVATIGAPGAVLNAVADALARLGVGFPQMPATPERIWRAIFKAGR